MLLKSGQKTPLDIIPLVNFESQMLKIIQCLILGYVCILSFESVCVRDIVISPPLTYWPHNHLNIYVCLYVMHILKYKYRVHIKSENNKTLNAIFYFSSRIIFLCVCVCLCADKSYPNKIYVFVDRPMGLFSLSLWSIAS